MTIYLRMVPTKVIQSNTRLVPYMLLYILLLQILTVNLNLNLSTEMEFAELIKISRVDNVRLRRPAEDPCEVTVAVTGHHLIMSIQV